MSKQKAVAVALLASAALFQTPACAEKYGHQSYDFDMPAQDLGDALRAVTARAGWELYATSNDVNGVSAPALHGNMTASEAVEQLLRGTGVKASIKGRAVIVRGRSSAAGATEVTAAASEIVVTGTHIRGGDMPVDVHSYSRASLDDAGQSDLGQFARSVPQNFNGGQNPGVAGGGDQGSNNENSSSSSTFNLRGLGADATLTLLNGHRVAYDTVSQGVDISQIPVAAIDRVEIVTDGASALYGSDAVGGVANILLRRDYDGALASTEIGGSTDGGAYQEHYDLLVGKRWGTGGFMAATDYAETSAINARNRDYTSNLDPSSTLVPWQSQVSGVLAGHQRLTDTLSVEIDGQLNRRVSEIDTPTTTTADVRTNELVARPHVTSGTINGTLRWDVNSSWTISATGTYGLSDNHILSSRFSGGVQSLQSHLDYDNSLASGELDAEGALVSLPGGNVRLAVGAGYRHLGLDVVIRQATAATSQVTTDIHSHRSVLFGYGELSIPFVGSPNRVPFVDRLQFDAAARYERYPGTAAQLSPKIGMLYRPVPDVTIRASWGKSFKTPTLYQQYEARQGALLPASLFSQAPNGLPVLLVAGGNSQLRPEKATSWAVGVDLTPKLVPGLKVGADYFAIDYRDRVVTPLTNILAAFSNPTYSSYVTVSPDAATVDAVVASLPQGLSNQSGAAYDPAAVGAIVDASLQNAAREHVHGVDLSASYALRPDGHDGLSLDASATYLTSDRELSSGFPLEALAGTIFNPPHWRARLGGVWRRGSGTLSAFANYIGGTRDTRYTPILGVGSYTSLDLVLQVRAPAQRGILSKTSLTFSVGNLLNEKPDLIRNSIATDPPYDSTNYPVTGRTLALTITKAF